MAAAGGAGEVHGPPTPSAYRAELTTQVGNSRMSTSLASALKMSHWGLKIRENASK